LHHFEFKAFRREFEWYVMISVFSWKRTFESVLPPPPPGVDHQGFVTSTIWQEFCSRKDQPMFLLLPPPESRKVAHIPPTFHTLNTAISFRRQLDRGVGRKPKIVAYPSLSNSAWKRIFQMNVDFCYTTWKLGFLNKIPEYLARYGIQMDPSVTERR